MEADDPTHDQELDQNDEDVEELNKILKIKKKKKKKNIRIPLRPF